MASSSLLSLPFLGGRKGARGYGHIETGITHYFTPKMLLCILVPAVLIGLGFDMISHMFMAGEVALNFAILTVFTVAITLATLNNFNVYKNARFIKRMGDIIDHGKHNAEEVNELLARMPSEGSLFDTNHMEGCIKNIERFGHPNFTDSDARMIKSKLGQRIGEKRKSVSFLGGLLVMMGLIGTYIGLLHTVDTVGEVMQSMSNIGGDDSAMNSFIGDLARPLKGMGLAFSASLFGIAGSVMTQIYGNFCNSAQGEFVENFSRWFDDRIPKFTQADKDKKVFGKAASADDLRTWLAGFVNLSVQTNRKMGQLVNVLNASSQASIRSARAIDQLMMSQQSTHGLIEQMSTSMVEFGRRSTDSQGITQIQSDIADLKVSAREISSAIPSLAQALHNMNAAAGSTNNSVREGLLAISQTMRTQSADVGNLTHTLQTLPQALTQLAQTQQLLLRRLENLQGTPSNPVGADKDPLSMEMSGLSGDLNELMEQMNVGNSELFDEMFAMSDVDDDLSGELPEINFDDDEDDGSTTHPAGSPPFGVQDKDS